MTIKTKKQYHKPQLTEVRLVVQNPVMATCASSSPLNPDIPCQEAGSDCADPVI